MTAVGESSDPYGHEDVAVDQDNYMDNTPSDQTNKIYYSDTSGLAPAFVDQINIGDYIYQEKCFIYIVEMQQNGNWDKAGELRIGQIIIVRRTNNNPVNNTDAKGYFEGVVNGYTNKPTVDAKITKEAVSDLLGVEVDQIDFQDGLNK